MLWYKGCGHNKVGCTTDLPSLSACLCDSFLHVCWSIFKDYCGLHYFHAVIVFPWSLYSFILFFSLSCSSKCLYSSCFNHPQKKLNAVNPPYFRYQAWNVDYHVHLFTVGYCIYCFERSIIYIMPFEYCSVPCICFI